MLRECLIERERSGGCAVIREVDAQLAIIAPGSNIVTAYKLRIAAEIGLRMERGQETILPADLPVGIKNKGRDLLYGQSAGETGIESELSQIQARTLGNTVVPEGAVAVAQIYHRSRIRRPAYS